MNTVFIHTNNKQGLGAILSHYSFKRASKNPDAFDVRYINTDETHAFQNFHGKKYLRAGREILYDRDDLQSFTLSRFMPPELMQYQGKAVVVDPDIFAFSDVNELFRLDMQGNPIAACRKHDAWDSSMMLLDCAQLRHWKISDILRRLEQKEIDYNDMTQLRKEESILELPRIWNNLDTLTPDTKLIHTTKRLTQPWKTGLKIDFIFYPNSPGEIFGFIPREPLLKLLGRIPTHYQPHPNREIEQFFFGLTKDALRDGAITREYLETEISQKHIRPDILEKIETI